MTQEEIKAVLDRHEPGKIALQLSGGKDSLACLYLCKAHLDKIVVYWCNTGDAYPETLEQMAQIQTWVPHFVEVAGRQRAVIQAFGFPSDLVPVSATIFGNLLKGGGGPWIQDRYNCCCRSLMEPMHERMMADGITLIIRGQKNADVLKPSLRSGDVSEGIEFFYPIENWTVAEIFSYLKANDAPIPRFYEMLDEAADCMTCSAWWEKGEAKYLKRYHYPQFLEVQRRLDVINAAVAPHIQHFNDEVNS